MTQEMSVHLSEEALNDVLIGLGSAESERHMARCAECRSRVEQFGSDVYLFNRASLAWSEARSARTVRAGYASPMFRVPAALWGALAAAILAVAVIVPVWRHEHAPAVDQENANELQSQDSQTQIAQDNQLMEAVNAALSPQDDSPVVEYGLLESPETHVQARPK